MPYLTDVNAELAGLMLQNVFQEQRKLDQNRVDIYATDMQAGRWRLTPEFILIGKIRDTLYLLAGQHRLSAIVQSGCTIPMWIEERTYESLEDMRKDYVITNKGKNISVHQAMKTLDTANSLGIGLKDMQSVVHAITGIASDFQGRRYVVKELDALIRDANAMNELALRLQAPIYAYFQALANAPKNERQWGLRAGVCAIGIITYYYQPEKAIEFWTTLFSNDGLRKGEPQHTLRNLLADSIKMETITPHNYALRVAKAWNAFYEGRTLTSFTGTHENQPIALAGTDYKDNNSGVKLINSLYN